MAESVKAWENYVPLLNDTVMKLGDDILTMRIELAEWSVLDYWKDLPNPDSTVAYRDILKMAKRSCPRFKALPGISDQPSRLTKTLVM